MTKPAVFRSLEPEHAIWLISRMATILSVVFLFRLALWPGLDFWADLLTVIPFMLMGGMCSESMMMLMISSLINFAVLCAAMAIAHFASRRLRYRLDTYKTQTRGRFLSLPGPTVWQARLNMIRMQRRYGAAVRPRARSS